MIRPLFAAKRFRPPTQLVVAGRTLGAQTGAVSSETVDNRGGRAKARFCLFLWARGTHLGRAPPSERGSWPSDRREIDARALRSNRLRANHFFGLRARRPADWLANWRLADWLAG